MDDLHAELMAAFAGELAEHMAGIRAALADADAGRAVDLRQFSRRAHSLKGAARAVDLPATEAAAHEAEALLLAIERGDRLLDSDAMAALRLLADAIEDGAAIDPAPGSTGGGDTGPDRRVAVAGHRVERLGRSLHLLSGQIAEQGVVAERLAALSADMAALQPLLARGGGADAVRRVAQATTELDHIRRLHRRLVDSLDRASTELERDGERLLLQPVATLFDGYERTVRDLAAAEGKQARLHLSDVAGEADRRVLNALRDPLLHVLRNAVRHGVESPDRRRRAGKPDEATIAIDIRIDRGQLVIAVRDDGAGLDDTAIERRARSAGLIAGNPPTREALHALLFAQGLSTADRLDEIAGRGIGLSVVAETARRLHGTATIAPASGGGTVVRLSVPVALTRRTLLLVEVGASVCAIPADTVRQVRRIAPADLSRSGGDTVLVIDGDALPVGHLADRLGVARAAGSSGTLPAIVLDSGGQRRVMVVDALRDVRALLVGDPAAIAADVPLVLGTVLFDGAVVLVLDAGVLVRGGGDALAMAPVTPAVDIRRRTILVVDDSITTRTLERSILEAQGYRVLVDVDGLAGLERLRSGIDAIDLVVADVEMPHMDGFGLLAAIRNDPAFKSLPVVMMTSRNSPDDIERGLTLGADAYVTKQDFDQGALIDVVQQLI